MTPKCTNKAWKATPSLLPLGPAPKMGCVRGVFGVAEDFHLMNVKSRFNFSQIKTDFEEGFLTINIELMHRRQRVGLKSRSLGKGGITETSGIEGQEFG